MAKSKASATPVAPSSNWKALKTAIKPSASTDEPPKKRKRRHSSVSADLSATAPSDHVAKGKGKDSEQTELPRRDKETSKREKKLIPVEEIMAGGSGAWQRETGQYLAMDCEMVGVGPMGVESTLARVSIVNYHGVTILDRFVRPREKVTDYRTWVSGVREEDLRHAPTFAEVQKEVANLLKGRILIGHALSNDTNVLLLSHPWHETRDTSKYSPLQGLAKTKKPGLKTLAKLVLGVDIQAGEHSSVIDARATMAIYRSQKSAWEDSLLKHTPPVLVTSTTRALASLDLTKISLTGVGKKKSVVNGSYGLSTVLRHVRNEREQGESGDEDEDEDKAEEVERERRKKRRVEQGEDLVLGFDFDKPEPVKASNESTGGRPPTSSSGQGPGGKKGPSTTGKLAGVGAGASRTLEKKVQRKQAFKGDKEKRPQAREGWWEEE
ncbi:hypothetical protein JCM10212_003243 [Sporobolomyces blumeae]